MRTPQQAPEPIEPDDEDFCEKCGSEYDYEDCWDCGGEGGQDGEELMMEDPMWYGPNDFRQCSTCKGKGTIRSCNCEEEE